VTGQDWFEKDFYAVLGVGKDATGADVKKAYRKKARTLHPDVNANDKASEARFKEVGEAYAVLSDPEKRQQYDSVRAMAGGARFTAGGPGHDAGGFEDLLGGLFGQAGAQNARFGRPAGAGAGGIPPGFEDLLGGLFSQGAGAPGGYPGAGSGPTRGPRRGADVQASTTLDFVDAVEGSTVTLQSAEGGQVRVRIPAGVKDGQKIRLAGKGRQGDPGSPAGDLTITVAVRPHPVFTRTGDDLRVTVPVSFPEAALGGEIEVPTVDGGTVRLKIPAGAPSGRTLRVKGRGITTKKGTGDLLVTVAVAVPQKLDEAARTAVEAFQTATASEDPRKALREKAARARAGGA